MPTENCLPNFNKIISSNHSNWEIWARTTRIEKCELDQGFHPYHPPFQLIVFRHRRAEDAPEERDEDADDLAYEEFTRLAEC